MMIRGFALLIATLWASTAFAQQRPNVLLIVTDDHCVQATSCYGGKIIQTPAMDRIAAAGTRFANAFVTNSLCGPSRACILTGKYTHANGFPDNQKGRLFDGSQTTFPKLLQSAGYETAIFGKWHLNGDPTGFDHWTIIQGWAKYFDPGFRDAKGKVEIKGYSTDTIFNLAGDFLKNRHDDRPFFLMVATNAPHRNWVSDPQHASMFKDQTIPEPPTFDDDLSTRTNAAHQCRMSIRDDLKKNDFRVDIPTDLAPADLKRWKYQTWVKQYLQTVAAVDDRLGHLLDQLQSSGQLQNTLVIYTSDNGFFLGDHGWFDKRFMYEPSLRVPLMIKPPTGAPAGNVSDAMVLNIDLAETILDYAGVQIPSEMQGQSLRPLLSGEPTRQRESIYYHYYEQEPEHNVAPHFGVRTKTHKLINFYTHNQWELYDLSSDPNELKNAYDDPGYAQVRGELTAELERLRRDLKDNTP